MSLLLTDNASPGSSDGMMPGYLVEEGRGHLELSWPLLGTLVPLYTGHDIYLYTNTRYQPDLPK